MSTDPSCFTFEGSLEQLRRSDVPVVLTYRDLGHQRSMRREVLDEKACELD